MTQNHDPDFEALCLDDKLISCVGHTKCSRWLTGRRFAERNRRYILNMTVFRFVTQQLQAAASPAWIPPSQAEQCETFHS